MKNEKRATLSLRKDKDLIEDEKRISVGLFDVLLPSRQFVVHHKVAEVGQLSLTAEFLLRLLHSIEGMEEQDIAQFFGFSPIEMAFVTNEVESRAYIRRQTGRVWLTEDGYGLFKDGDKPQIFDVVKRTEKIGFDLLSMAPCERENLSGFERALPELEIRDVQRAAVASQEVPDAFRRHYREIVGRKDRDLAAGVKKSLYSIDEVVVSDRFSSVVPVLAVTNTRNQNDVEPVLDAWRTGHELDDRNAVVNAVALFLDNLKTTRRMEDVHAYKTVLELAPEYLKEYKTRDGISVTRFFKETTSRAGELRADRPTVGIVGPIYSPENSERVFEALAYSSKSEHVEDDGTFLWVIPNSATWGTSRALVTFLERMASESKTKTTGRNKLVRSDVALTCGRPQKHLIKVFQKMLQAPDNGAIPTALEVFLVPRRVAAVTVHAPIGAERGFPIPLGILSFDPTVVRRVHEYIQSQLPQQVGITDAIEKFNIYALMQWQDAVDHVRTDAEG